MGGTGPAVTRRTPAVMTSPPFHPTEPADHMRGTGDR